MQLIATITSIIRASSCLSPESSSDRVAALQVDAATIINININIITINAGVGHAMRLHHRRQQHQ